ncbi:MOSC domain-containing protein [Rhodococcus sp. X156]|uniref:MOSC domain-containing protein n=1 Tax=Rhodococcus sp. X156 TaxID=2499145 RepID=UPI000FD956DA|nr:MOSC domain-containing protein [Rhodococcus sp. X156]
MSTPTTTVASLHRFPVKSMLGEDLDSCVIGDRGVVGDRAYALLDTEDGTVASGKNPRKWAALLQMRARFVAEPHSGEVPPPVEITFADGSVLRSDDPGVDEALSAAVGRPVRLVCEHPGDARFEEVWPDIDGLAPPEVIASTASGTEPTGETVSTMPLGMLAPGTFYDLALLHVLSTATLQRLAELNPEADFDVRRYRPNLVLDGGAPGFVEDGWVGQTVAIGERARIGVTMLTMRCVMTTLAQHDLPADPATLRTIAKHHRKEIPGLGVWACAGVYAGVEQGGVVRVGDEVVL